MFTDVGEIHAGASVTSVNTVKTKADMSRDGNRLVFHNVKHSDQVAVYTVNGIRVPVRLQCNGSDAMLTLSQIPSGVYLLSVNGKTSKFTRP